MVDSRKFIRNFNLHILCETELEQPYLSIYNRLENIFKYTNIYKGIENGLLTYYVGENKDNIIFYYSPSNRIIVGNYDSLYEPFQTIYGFSPFHFKILNKWYITYKFDLKKDIDIWYGYPGIGSEDEYFEVDYMI